ncbi:MAG TPA: hypothetical protein VFI73_11615, partial [Candidatus Nitrosopolaris sp.]|nr:hypothetical protein [Candidatus Nitrosopolaris sp.]
KAFSPRACVHADIIIDSDQDPLPVQSEITCSNSVIELHRSSSRLPCEFAVAYISKSATAMKCDI